MRFDDSGFEIIADLLPQPAVDGLLATLSRLALEPGRGGIRRIDARLPEVAALAQSPALLDVAQQHLSGAPRLVRAIYFDKSPGNNWLVTWHQDRTVAVSARFEQAGWGPWSVKAEAWHVQPPLTVLQSMVTLRLHLDEAKRDNGCLKVMPGSHKLGLIPTEKVLDHVDDAAVVYCESPAGGAVVMRPHILHASEKAEVPLPRRILHFEYAAFELPEGIVWAA